MIEEDKLFKQSQSDTSSLSLENHSIDWYQRCIQLELSLQRSRNHSNKVKQVLLDKVTGLEKKIQEIEMNSRNERLIHLQKVVQEKQKLINDLENQIEEQKKLRIQDAKQVEAKAAKIKEWVSSKFKELEQQNESLKEENRKCHEYLTNFQNFFLSPEVKRKFGPLSFDVCNNKNHLVNLNSFQTNLTSDSTYAIIDPRLKKSAAIKNKSNQFQVLQSTLEEKNNDIQIKKMPNTKIENSQTYSILPPRSHNVNYQCSNTSFTPQLPKKSYNYLDSKNSLKQGGSLDRKLKDKQKMSLQEQKSQLTNTDSSHNTKLDGDDYSEVCNSDCESNLIIEKPPTPPLHRIPSWEKKIYKIALDGTKNASKVSINLKNFSIKPCLSSLPSRYENVATNVFIQTFTQNNAPLFSNFNDRASQIQSISYSDESVDSSDNETDLKSAQINSLQKIESNSCFSKVSKNSKFLNDYELPSDAGTIPLSQACFHSSSANDSLINFEPKIPKRVSSLQREVGGCISNLDSFQKFGHLMKLGSKLKTWHKRWFVLKDNQLSYYKSQNDVLKGKAKTVITLNETCCISKAEGCTFNLSIDSGKKVYYLTADSAIAMEDWIRQIQNTIKNNSKKDVENSTVTIQGRLVQVKNQQVQKCWCTLVGSMFIYLSSGCLKYEEQINMEQAKVEEVLNYSINKNESSAKIDLSSYIFTIAIIPKQLDQSPIYLLFSNRQEMDVWLYHLSLVSDNHNLNGTHFEKIVSKLFNSDCSDIEAIDNNPLWNDPCLLFSKECITSPLTTLSTDYLCSEALKLFKSIQLFTSVALDFSAIDYHISLIQNFLQLCFDHSELQNELFCQLIKQTSLPSSKFQTVLSNYNQTPFVLNQKSSTAALFKDQDNNHSLKQAFQLLSLTISLFTPKEKVLWLLKHHLRRNGNVDTETGKYAIFALRALNRILLNGPRKFRPSRMEVLGILLRNPFQHSKPHSFLVHFANLSYLVIGFDGSTTIDEFVDELTKEANLRASHLSGFALFCDDPLDSKVEHLLKGKIKLADVISLWESILRENHFGKFETTRVLKLTYKNRLCLKKYQKSENDKEKLLLVYQYQINMKNGHFPINYQLSLELSALLAQIEFGDVSNSTLTEDLRNKISQKFIPYDENDAPTNLAIQEIFSKWKERKGCNQLDCLRIFLKCARMWKFCGANLFEARTKKEIKIDTDDKVVKINQGIDLWIAVMEDGISLLDYSFQHLIHYPMKNILSFGVYKEDFMLIIESNSKLNYIDVDPPATTDSFNDLTTSANVKSNKLLFSMTKKKLIDITFLIADYINNSQISDSDQVLNKFSPNTLLEVSSLPQTKI